MTCLELLDHFRAHDVDRRVVDRDTPIGGRPAGQANLCGFGASLVRGSLVGALIVAMGSSSVIIQPEQNGPRNWTMVLPILSYRLPCVHTRGIRLFSIQLARKSIKAKEASSSTLDTKVWAIPRSNCFTPSRLA